MAVRHRVPAAALSLAAALAAAPARGAELRAGPGGFPSIGEALRAASPGDDIRVAPGRYRETLVVDRPVRVVGEPGAVIDGGGRGDVITVAAPGASIEGMVITGSGRRLEEDHAGVKVRADRVVLRRNRLEGNVHGIYLLSVSGAVVEGNEIEGDPRRAMEDRGDGIHLFDSHGNVLRKNRIRRARDGVYLDSSGNNRVEGNEATDLRFGIHSMNSRANRIEGNTLARDVVGAALMLSHGLTVRRNRFNDNRDPRAYGVLLKDCDSSLIEDNVIAGNARGLSLDNANRNRIARNVIALNGTAMVLAGNSSRNAIWGNAFVQNWQDVLSERGRARNAWTAKGRGNFWDRYKGYDLDGDGVGDVPHRTGSLSAYLAQIFPELLLFAGSPALNALDWAERSFPVFSVPAVRDPAPLIRPPSFPGGLARDPRR